MCDWVTGTEILFKNESVAGLCEFKLNHFIASFMKTQKLVKVINCKDCIDIKAPNALNDNKHSIQLLNDFDVEEYPFFLVSGAAGIWVGGLDTLQMEPLVSRTGGPVLGMNGVSFLPKTTPEQPSSFFFNSFFINPNNKTQYEIHEMTLHKDFKDTLIAIGKLPEVTTQRVIQLEKENIAQKKMLEELKAEIAKLNASVEGN